jgi:ABC-2 type transport system permease protein
MASRTTSHPGASIFGRIGAIARRDMTIERSYHFRLFLQFFNALFTVATFFFLSKLVGTSEHLQQYGGRYFTFALVGVLVTQSSYLGLRTFSATITREQDAGTLEVLLSTPTRLPALMAGTLVVPAAFTTIELALWFTIAAAFFQVRFPVVGLLIGLPILALTLLVFCSIGIFAAAFIVLTKKGEPFTLVATQATTFLAGAMFPVALLPSALQVIAHMVPAYYSLTGLRAVLLSGSGFVDVIDEMLVLAAFAAAFLPLSLLALRRAIRSARVTGTLANY